MEGGKGADNRADCSIQIGGKLKLTRAGLWLCVHRTGRSGYLCTRILILSTKGSRAEACTLRVVCPAQSFLWTESQISDKAQGRGAADSLPMPASPNL